MGVLPIRGAPVTGCDPHFGASGDILPSLVWALHGRVGSRAQAVQLGRCRPPAHRGKSYQEMAAWLVLCLLSHCKPQSPPKACSSRPCPDASGDRPLPSSATRSLGISFSSPPSAIIPEPPWDFCQISHLILFVSCYWFFLDCTTFEK